jgi:hypothetical protein
MQDCKAARAIWHGDASPLAAGPPKRAHLPEVEWFILTDMG